MAGLLLHSPADIIARLLIALGQGVATGSGAPWQVQADAEPSSPDDTITVYNELGNIDARSMLDGEYMEHEGFQVRVRATDSKIGFKKIRSIADQLAKHVHVATVVIDASTYLIYNCCLKGNVIPLGRQPGTKRFLFTLNGTVALREVS